MLTKHRFGCVIGRHAWRLITDDTGTYRLCECCGVRDDGKVLPDWPGDYARTETRADEVERR